MKWINSHAQVIYCKPHIVTTKLKLFIKREKINQTWINIWQFIITQLLFITNILNRIIWLCFHTTIIFIFWYFWVVSKYEPLKAIPFYCNCNWERSIYIHPTVKIKISISIAFQILEYVCVLTNPSFTSKMK